MTGTALVAQRAYTDTSGKVYAFALPDVHVMGRVYLMWGEFAKNETYPERIRMSLENWALFRSWFPQFAGVSDEVVADVSDTIAEDVIMHDAMKRLLDPVWQQREQESMTSFFEWLRHEPKPEFEDV